MSHRYLGGLRQLTAISLLASTAALAGCGDSKDAAAGKVPKTTPKATTNAATPVAVSRPDGTVAEVAKALSAAGIDNQPGADASAGMLKAGIFTVMAYADVPSAKKASRQFDKLFSSGGGNALVAREGTYVVVGRGGVKPTAAQRKQFKKIQQVVADA